MMQNETPDFGPVEWRNLLHFDAKAIAAILGCALFLIGLLAVLPAWLRAQDRDDFAGAALRSDPGIVLVCQISPVSQGGGSLFNAVTVGFAKRQAYYALPPASTWQPVFHQKVWVKYRVGRSGTVRVEAVLPEWSAESRRDLEPRRVWPACYPLGLPS